MLINKVMSKLCMFLKTKPNCINEEYCSFYSTHNALYNLNNNTSLYIHLNAGTFLATTIYQKKKNTAKSKIIELVDVCTEFLQSSFDVEGF